MTAVNDRRRVAADAASIPNTVPTWQRTYARWLAVADTVAVILAVGLAQLVRFGGFDGGNRDYLEVSIAIAAAWLLALTINHSRSYRVIGSGAEEYRRVWLGTISVFGGVAIISMLLKLQIARGYLAVALPTGVGLLMLFRWIARKIVIRAREKHGRCRRRGRG